MIAALDKMDDDGEESIEFIDESREEDILYAKDFEKIYWVSADSHVQTFLTEKAAQDFIERNGHRYKNKLFMYVESAHRNFEMQAIQEFIRNVDLEKLK